MKRDITFKIAMKNLGILLISMICVVIFNKLFGTDNNWVGVFTAIALTMFMMLKVELNLKSTIVSIMLSFILIGIAPYFSNLNPILGIIINFLSVFAIMYLYKDSEKNMSYMPFMLGYIFIEGNPVTGHSYFLRLIGLISGGIIVSIIYFICHHSKEHKDISIKSAFCNIDVHSLRFNYSIRMAIGITIAMFIGTIFNFQRSMWISITVMSLTQPHLHQTKERIKARTAGTIIGAILFVIIFVVLVPHEYSFILLLILSYIYTFVEKYNVQMIFITMNSLSATQVLLGSDVSVFLRICFVGIGAIIAWIINITGYKPIEKKLQNNSNQRKTPAT